VTTNQPPDLAALRIGHVAGVTLTKWHTIWRQRFRHVRLDVVEVTQADQRQVLIDGSVDMCFVRLPIETAGLHLIRLYEEVPVAWAAKDHALAAVDEVSIAELDGENLLRLADQAAIEQAANGEAVLLVPQSIARSHSRRDLIYRPITDAETTAVALAWPINNDSESIQEFIGIVRGRTENSSRTAQARTAGQDPVKKAKAKTKPPRGNIRGRRR
jgi:DNA-binding transcriptional LysR family regulator